MTWLQRYRLSQYFKKSLWTLPALGLFAGLVAFWPLHAIEEVMGWKLQINPSTAQTVLATLAASMFTFISDHGRHRLKGTFPGDQRPDHRGSGH